MAGKELKLSGGNMAWLEEEIAVHFGHEEGTQYLIGNFCRREVYKIENTLYHVDYKPWEFGVQHYWHLYEANKECYEYFNIEYPY